MEDFVRDEQNLKINSLFSWELGQTLYDWSNVNPLFCSNS